jgi:hypothetical protein
MIIINKLREFLDQLNITMQLREPNHVNCVLGLLHALVVRTAQQ